MRRPALLLVPLTLLVPWACAGGPGRSPREVLVAAPAATAAAGTARIHVQVDLGSGEHRLVGRGAVDFDRGRSTLTLRAGGGIARLRRDGATTYLRTDALSLVLPAAPEHAWLALPPSPDVRDADVGVTGAGLATTASSEALALLGFLEQDRAPVHDEGGEDVRGVATTRYRITDADDPARVTLRVWVDGQGRVRRLELDLPTPTHGRARLTTDYYDFGATVDVSPPPADQVVSLPDR